MSSVLYCGGYQVLRGFLSPEVRCLVWKESPWPVRDCGQWVWEYGSMGWWRRSVCWKRRSVCGVCTLQYLSISMGGRSINNNNNDDDNNNDDRDGDHNIDDVGGEEEVKVTKDVVVEGWWMRGDTERTHDWLWTPVCFLPSIWMATCLMWSMVPGL